jgi:hypothetical protein
MGNSAHASKESVPVAAWLHLGITALRYAGAVWGTRGQDTAPIERFRAKSPEALFTIFGPGASLNDLTSSEHAAISKGTSAAINMAALAPLDFDICSLEAIVDQRDLTAYQQALVHKSRPPLLWYQDRAKHENEMIARLDSEFGLYRYRRASVSVKQDLRNFELVLRKLMVPSVFERPNLRVCFAVTGSVARLTLLGLALGYRRIYFSGIDLGSTPYFWLDDRTDSNQKTHNLSSDYTVASVGAMRQGSGGAVPNFFEFLTALSRARDDLDFATFDPKKRSLLTPFLENLKNIKRSDNCG